MQSLVHPPAHGGGVSTSRGPAQGGPTCQQRPALPLAPVRRGRATQSARRGRQSAPLPLQGGSRRPGYACCASSRDEESDDGPQISDWDLDAEDARVYRTLAMFANGDALENMTDLNQLQTGLAAALTAEDYTLAARIRDRLKQVMGTSASRIDWAALGLPDWLCDRAERLGFKYPSEIQRRAAPVILSGLDAVIQSETGSGKTLAFLMPTLASLDYPPEQFPDDLQGPQAIVVVPSLELGVQCALTVYKLYGGSLSARKPGDPANMFTYMGPKNIKVRGLLNKEEVAMATGTDYLKGVHVVVATPPALMEVYSGTDRKAVLDFLKVLVVDEYDECFKVAPEAMTMMLSCACNNNVAHKKPQVVLVGATITPDQIELAAQAKWIREPARVLVGKEGSVPSGLQHRYVVCEPGRKLAILARLLRKDLEDQGDNPLQPARAMVFANSVEEAAAATEPLRSALWSDHQMAVLLPPGSGPQLTQDREEVKKAAMFELAGSSPFSASDPIRAMHSFRDNTTSLLLCTPQAARGLDLPAVSHVYNLGVPSDNTQYLHRAGRAGRIGSATGGIVTTLVTEDEIPELEAIADQLGISVAASQAPDTALVNADVDNVTDIDSLRKGLEDVYNLL